MKLSSATYLLFSALALSFARAQPPVEECGRECEPGANEQDGTNKRCININPACKFCKETGGNGNIGVCVPEEDPPTPPPTPSEPQCGHECDPVSGLEDEINKSCYLIDQSCPYCYEGICVPEKTKEPTSPPTRSPIDPPTDPPTRSPVGPPKCGRMCDPIYGQEHEVNQECRWMNPDCPYCIADDPSSGFGKCMRDPPVCGHQCQLNGQDTQPNPDCMNVSPHCPFCIPDGSSAIGKCAETPSQHRRLRSV